MQMLLKSTLLLLFTMISFSGYSQSARSCGPVDFDVVSFPAGEIDLTRRGKSQLKTNAFNFQYIGSCRVVITGSGGDAGSADADLARNRFIEIWRILSASPWRVPADKVVFRYDPAIRSNRFTFRLISADEPVETNVLPEFNR
jgi:hypothetical protein